MKVGRVLALCFCSLFFASQGFAEITEDPSAAEELRSDETVSLSAANVSNVTSGAKLSIGIFKKAISKANSYWRKVLSKVYKRYLRSSYRYPKRGYEYKHCKKNSSVLAFVIMGRNYIYLCRRTVTSYSYKFIAQVFTHEAAHIAGYRNECDATKIEVSAMRLSGVGLIFRNGYMKRCGIK